MNRSQWEAHIPMHVAITTERVKRRCSFKITDIQPMSSKTSIRALVLQSRYSTTQALFSDGTALPAGRSRVRFPMMSLEIFHWHNPSRLWVLRIFPGVQRADNLPTFMCRLSWNLGSSVPWFPQGFSNALQGLLYFYDICLQLQGCW